MELHNVGRQVKIKMSDDSIKSLLLRAKDLSDDEAKAIESLLHQKKLLDLKEIAKDLRIRLTSTTRKQDIVDRILYMA